MASADAAPASAAADPAARRTVGRMGWLHFANDLTLDFLTPLLPAGVPVAWLGVMEGTADAAGQLLRLATGRASDRSGRRVPWVAAGYSANALARVLAGLGLLLAWPAWIVACRIADRLGKGVRGSASDALVADWSAGPARARAFARMRTMDHLGATLGGLAAALAAWLVPADRLGWAVLGLAPVALWVVWLCRGLADRDPHPAAGAAPGGWWPRDPGLRRPLAAIAVGSLAARLSPLLVLVQVAGLPAEGGGGAWPLWAVCLGWAAFGLVQAGAAELAGVFTARLGPVAFLRLGWLAGAAACLAIAVASGPWLIAAGLAWGVVTGLTEGAEKTWLAERAGSAERALAFGALAVLGALAGLAGNALAGFGLAWFGPGVFAVLAVAGLAGVLLTLGEGRRDG